MNADESEEKLLRSVALQNAKSILLARERTDLALERKTEELARSLARMRATLESTTDAILVTDAQGMVTDFNTKYVEMWRIPPEVMETREHRQMLEITAANFKDREDFLARVKTIYASSPPETFDLLEFTDGRVVERFSRIQFVEGQNVGRVWSFRDITQRKQAEEIRSRLAALVESSDDAILSKTLDGIIRTWNQGAQRMFGYSADEIIGEPVTVLIPHDRLDEEVSILERLKQGKRIEHYDTIRRKKDGTLFHVSLTVSPVKDSYGKIIGASKIARDITERKRSEEALREAKEKLSRYAEELEHQVAQRTAHLRESIQSLESVCYTIAHDLRAPLRAVQGFTKIILDDYAPAFDDTGKQFAERIVVSAGRMDRLIRDLLDFAKLSHVELPCVNLDLNLAARNVLRNMSLEIEATHAQINLQPLPVVWANQILFEQILANLLGNSLKFVEEGVIPRIEIRAEKQESFVRVFVRDNGIGIRPEYHERVFGMFQRLYGDEKKYPGTGVGLAIVKKGMERMGGRVAIDSTGASGTCFHLDFRLAKGSP